MDLFHTERKLERRMTIDVVNEGEEKYFIIIIDMISLSEED